MSHEDLSRPHEIEGSSDRSFGFVFTAVFLIIALWPLLGGNAPRVWALLIAAAFLVVAMVRPALLRKPNKAWMRLGILMGMVVSPIALGLLFFTAFTLTSLLLRMAGKDPLRLRLDKTTSSYWIRRTPPGPPAGSMSNQF